MGGIGTRARRRRRELDELPTLLSDDALIEWGRDLVSTPDRQWETDLVVAPPRVRVVAKVAEPSTEANAGAGDRAGAATRRRRAQPLRAERVVVGADEPREVVLDVVPLPEPSGEIDEAVIDEAVIDEAAVDDAAVDEELPVGVEEPAVDEELPVGVEEPAVDEPSSVEEPPVAVEEAVATERLPEPKPVPEVADDVAAPEPDAEPAVVIDESPGRTREPVVLDDSPRPGPKLDALDDSELEREPEPEPIVPPGPRSAPLVARKRRIRASLRASVLTPPAPADPRPGVAHADGALSPTTTSHAAPPVAATATLTPPSGVAVATVDRAEARRDRQASAHERLRARLAAIEDDDFDDDWY